MTDGGAAIEVGEGFRTHQPIPGTAKRISICCSDSEPFIRARLSQNLRRFNLRNADCACCEAESASLHDLAGFRSITLYFTPVVFPQARFSSFQITSRFPPLSIAHTHAS
jgi:hypothetical protein